MLLFMDKRGISAIVATVLVILITIAGVAIIWVGVLPMIQDSFAFQDLDGRVSVVGSSGYTVYDSSREIATVQVKRDVDEGVMDRIKISFVISGDSVSSNVVAPGSGETKVYSFDFSGHGVPSEVGVAPIFVSASGNEKEGSVTSEIKIPVGRISEIVGIFYDLGSDNFIDMIPSGVVSIWNFSGDLVDSVGGSVGNFYDNAYVNGGGELVLDGNGDYIGINNYEDTFDFDSSFSVCLWAKLGTKIDEAAGVPMQTLFSNWMLNDAGQGLTSLGLFMEVTSDERIARATYRNNNSVNSWNHWGGEVPLDDWKFIAATYDVDSFNDNAKLYVDAKLVVSSSETFTTPITGRPLLMGALSPSEGPYDRWVNGSIDNVMVFDRALSSEELKVIYNIQAK